MVFFIPLISLMIMIIYLYISNFSMNMVTSMGYPLIFDEFSLFMIYMTCFIIFTSYIVSMNFYSFKLGFSLFFILIISCLAFMIDNMLYFYILYEFSLIPILFIIMKWGSYPERSLSSIMLLLYTSIFTFPFMYILLSYYNEFGTFTISIFYLMDYNPSSLLVSLIIFFTFAVKLPIYGLHYWLPMAHVEAPTFGSMILAGILLKLGGIGLIRFLHMLNLVELKSILLGYFLVFLVYSSIICCMQSDFKRLIAYSSVSHMMSIPILLFSNTFMGMKGVVGIMFLHGISSSLLFLIVGIIYSFMQTRQLLLMRGIALVSPLLSFFLILSFFFTISAPPYPSFIIEVFFSISLIFLWFKSMYFLFLFLFLSVVYNLLWLTSITFLNQNMKFSFSFSFSFSYFLPLFMSLFMVPLLFMSLFYFM